jgi:hypothetical protein
MVSNDGLRRRQGGRKVCLGHTANLHQCSILGRATWSSIKPDDSTLSVRNMPVLEMPEEDVAIVLGGDFNVTARPISRYH